MGLKGDIVKPSQLLNLSEVEKAYLAGLIDADGSIFLSYYKYPRRRKKNIGIHSIISCAISCRTANRSFAEEIVKMMGTKVTRVQENYWEVAIERHADVLQMADAILPYLRLKRREAEIIIEYCKERLTHLKEKRNAPFTPKCFELVEKMKKLNRTLMNKRKWK